MLISSKTTLCQGCFQTFGGLCTCTYNIVNLYIVIPYLLTYFIICVLSVTVILLQCGSYCHKNKFLLNIPGNKAHSDSGLVGSLLQISELSVSTPPLTADAYIPGEARRVLNEPNDIKEPRE